MCLIRRELKPMKMADKDVICYKVVVVPYEMWCWKTRVMHFLRRFNNYITIFMGDPVDIGENTESVVAKPEFSMEELHEIEACDHSITQGFIHSYVNKADAKSAKNITWSKRYVAIVECIIPKDAFYFEGTNGHYPCYASTKLKYVKIVG